jgi:hypothetical protein
MKTSIFYYITSRSPLKVNRLFRKKNLWGRKIHQTRNQHEVGSKQNFMLVSYFNPEDEGHMFLQKFG